jgi:type IV pilus assembly protein PilW
VSHARHIRRQLGVGLVEIMIAMVLGLLLTSAMFQVYLSNKRNFELQDTLTRRQETARFAALTLIRDAHSAGFRGCLRDLGTVRNTLNDAGGFLYSFDQHVQGFDAQGGAWSPALPPGFPAPVPGADVLTLRGIADPGVFTTAAMPNNSADLTTIDDLDPPPLAAGEIALIADCGGAAIFQITDYVVASGTIVHGAGVADTPGNASQDLGRRFPAGSQIFRVSTTSYFISNSPSGTGPSLWRRVGQEPAQELAEGVENLQVLYGQDNDANQVADLWVTAGNVTDWRNVVVLRVALLVAGVRDRASEEDPRTFTVLDEVLGPFGDGRLRRALTFTVALRNRLS